VLVVRKLGAPHQPELAIGAVTDDESPQQILNEDLIRRLGVDDDYLEREIASQLEEVRRRQALYRRGRAAVPIAGRTVIVVDDGIATGATVRAGLIGLRQTAARPVVLAVPVAPPEATQRLGCEVDELVCLETPASFMAVGAFYLDFRQVTDEEVVALLEEATKRRSDQAT
jgi:putative phosphoribosyl transferase